MFGFLADVFGELFFVADDPTTGSDPRNGAPAIELTVSKGGGRKGMGKGGGDGGEDGERKGGGEGEVRVR